MNLEKHSESLSGDRPLINPADDKLGGRYAKFAQDITENIIKIAPASGFVIAVHAEWGMGKSTVLNFIEYYLNEKDVEEKPIIIRFNPWWFSGEDDLLKRFFNQLYSTFSRIPALKELADNLMDLAVNLLDYIATPETKSKLAKESAKTVFRFLQKKIATIDLNRLKQEIEKKLNKQDEKIIIIIDDLDRLMPDEIRSLFRLIKAVANFPNVIYLLAFDKKIVARALSNDRDLNEGQEYLEKIVQVPYELPLLDQYDLKILLTSKLDKYIGDFPEDLFSTYRWFLIYQQGIKPLIRTPRDITRLINSIRVSYPMVKGEVNIVDFIGIEVIKIFYPDIYELIKNHQDKFLSDPVSRDRFTADVLSTGEDPKIVQFHDQWMKGRDTFEKERILSLLVYLFPKIQNLSLIKDLMRSSLSMGFVESESEWRKQLRVCTTNSFGVYFRFGLTPDEIAQIRFKEIIASMNESDIFEQNLLNLLDTKRREGGTHVMPFLEKMIDYADKEIPEGNIKVILTVFFRIGDKLFVRGDMKEGSLTENNLERIVNIIFILLRRVLKDQRREMIQDTMSCSEAVITTTYFVSRLGYEHGLYNHPNAIFEENRVLTIDDFRIVEQKAIDILKNAVAADALLDSPYLAGVVRRWRDWDKDKAAKWISEQIETDHGLVKIIESFFHPEIMWDATALEDLFLHSKDVLTRKIEETLRKPDLSQIQIQAFKKAQKKISEL